MKRWKKILHNCPYLIALLSMWLFLTVGGICLMIYRGYGQLEWKSFWSHPFFAVILNDELYDRMMDSNEIEAVMAEPVEEKKLEKIQEIEIISSVISNTAEKDGEKLNINIINMLLEDANESMKSETADSASAKTAVTIPLLERLGQDTLQTGESNQMTSEEEGLLTASATEEHNTEKNDAKKADGEDEETKEEVVGKTLFKTYTPIETDSIYYSDAGKIAMTTEYSYQKVQENYFNDAAFLGDSRTLGIADYAGLDADFYCENGMTIYKLLGEKGIVYQKSGEKVDLNQVLQEKQYGKIYLMLGMNELGYGNTERYLEQYDTVLKQIREWQPNAVIFIQANLHVSREKNNPETEFNNVNINDKNAAAASLANGTDVFYLDSNPLFVDKDGFLKEDLTFDGVHLLANNYIVWKNFLMEHGVIRENEG